MNVRRLLFSFGGLLLPCALAMTALAALAASACSTDNGENAYGPDYGPLPKRDGAADADDETEGGAPDPDGGPIDDGGDEAASPCTSGTIAVLAGSDGSLTGAVQERNGAWVTSAIAGGAAKSKPALVAFGGEGFLGVTHGTGDALQTTSYGPSGWSAATPLGNAGVKGAPSLAVAGTKAHVVYSAGAGTNHDFAHGIHDGTSWNAATAQVDSVEDDHSFGTVSAGLAAAGDDVVFAENGTNQGLYVRTFGTSWSKSVAIAGAGTVGTTFAGTPEIVPVEGAFDLLLAYTDNNPSKAIAFATRDSAPPNAWKNGGNVPGASTTEKLSLARVGQFTVLLTFRGEDDKGYYVQGTIGLGNVNWSAAKPIGGGAAFAVDSTPAVAKGVCGDDAVLAYASGGVVRVTRLRGTSWTPAETVGTATGTRVAIATR